MATTVTWTLTKDGRTRFRAVLESVRREGRHLLQEPSCRKKMSAPMPDGGASPRSPRGSVWRPWPMARAGTPAGLATRAGADVARRGLRFRNALTGLGIGAIVVGIYGYTFYSVSQERFLDELELEAEVVRARGAKTPTD